MCVCKLNTNLTKKLCVVTTNSANIMLRQDDVVDSMQCPLWTLTNDNQNEQFYLDREKWDVTYKTSSLMLVHW